MRCDPCTIEQVVIFVRSRGFDLVSLMARRQYGSTGTVGLWKNGSAGVIKRNPTSEGATDLQESSKRFKSMNKELTDETVCDEESPEKAANALVLQNGSPIADPESPAP